MSVEMRDGTTVEDPRLGRLKQFDEKSRNFPLSSVVIPGSVRSYTWRCDTFLDQGQEGSCVGHGVAHEIAARPVPTAVTSDVAFSLYRDAQVIDEWPGEAYSGTSVLAGMKAATARGYYAEYRWAFTLEEAVRSLAYRGPLVLGLNWYEGMYEPNEQGLLTPTGQLTGGHCLLAKGIKCVFRAGATTRTFADLDLDASTMLLHNSWGIEWGNSGTARITLSAFSVLQQQEGEVCVPFVRKPQLVAA